MGLNADMLDSDQNHVKVELFHAQFQNLANKTSFLVGVREIQGGETAEPISPASPSVASCPAIGARGAFWVVFDIPSFDILVLSEDLERLCQSCLDKTPESIVDISSASSRYGFCDQLQLLANRSLNLPESEERQEQTLWFLLLLDDVFMFLMCFLGAHPGTSLSTEFANLQKT